MDSDSQSRRRTRRSLYMNATKALDVHWKDQMPNSQLYAALQRLSVKIRERKDEACWPLCPPSRVSCEPPSSLGTHRWKQEQGQEETNNIRRSVEEGRKTTRNNWAKDTDARPGCVEDDHQSFPRRRRLKTPSRSTDGSIADQANRADLLHSQHFNFIDLAVSSRLLKDCMCDVWDKETNVSFDRSVYLYTVLSNHND